MMNKLKISMPSFGSGSATPSNGEQREAQKILDEKNALSRILTVWGVYQRKMTKTYSNPGDSSLSQKVTSRLDDSSLQQTMLHWVGDYMQESGLYLRLYGESDYATALEKTGACHVKLADITETLHERIADSLLTHLESRVARYKEFESVSREVEKKYAALQAASARQAKKKDAEEELDSAEMAFEHARAMLQRQNEALEEAGPEDVEALRALLKAERAYAHDYAEAVEQCLESLGTSSGTSTQPRTTSSRATPLMPSLALQRSHSEAAIDTTHALADRPNVPRRAGTRRSTVGSQAAPDPLRFDGLRRNSDLLGLGNKLGSSGDLSGNGRLGGDLTASSRSPSDAALASRLNSDFSYASRTSSDATLDKPPQTRSRSGSLLSRISNKTRQRSSSLFSSTATVRPEEISDEPISVNKDDVIEGVSIQTKRALPSLSGLRKPKYSTLGEEPVTAHDNIFESAEPLAEEEEEDVFYSAKWAYNASVDDGEELSFGKGDILRVDRHITADWCIGTIVQGANAGQTGMFPSQYVTPVDYDGGVGAFDSGKAGSIRKNRNGTAATYLNTQYADSTYTSSLAHDTQNTADIVPQNVDAWTSFAETSSIDSRSINEQDHIVPPHTLQSDGSIRPPPQDTKSKLLNSFRRAPPPPPR